MYNTGDIVKLLLWNDETAHYLLLDSDDLTKYTILCLETGIVGTRIKHQVDFLAIKVA